jgi:nucleoside-diphosphate-sugar epimerase
MGKRTGILMTGATGLLGRFLLRDLLECGHNVNVLVRDSHAKNSVERVDELLAGLSEQTSTSLRSPIVLSGDLTAADLGLSAADRAWVGRSCRSVVHAGACIHFSAAGGDPWQTNVQGTEHLLRLCTRIGLSDVHHVSTAFVCGDRAGPIRAHDLDVGQRFHNDYERSKCGAERLLRRAGGPRVTVYRPSVIVGHSQTGFTSSYHGPYRFLALGDRLARPEGGGRRLLPLRLPFTGEETHNLVCVDWVAGAIRRIFDRPWLHGRNYHLVARAGVRVRFVHDVAREVLGIDGVSWAGPHGPAEPTHLEALFQDHLHEYWPYCHGHPVFLDDTRAALPDWQPPPIDRALLGRLIRFAVEDRWGRQSRPGRAGGATVDCVDYMERFFPEAVRRSSLAEMPQDVTVGLDVRGPGGGCWTCRWSAGTLASIDRVPGAAPEVTYRLNLPTFAAVIAGRLPVEEAFYTRRIDILGDVEMGLRLAVLFNKFVQEHPYPSFAEPAHACA